MLTPNRGIDASKKEDRFTANYFARGCTGAAKGAGTGDKVQLYWPSTNGEWLAWASALATILFGLICLFAPRLTYRLLRLQTHPNHPEALSESRATMAGFYLGLGLCCILLAQPMLWIALGVSWGFTAFGRLISMLSDDGNTLFNWISVIMEAALALLPLAYAFEFIP
jgi:cytochrome c biogenesis protein CcdA